MFKKILFGAIISTSPLTVQAIDVNDSNAGSPAFLFDFATTNWDEARDTVGNSVVLEKVKKIEDRGDRLDDPDTGVANSMLRFASPNAFVSNQSFGKIGDLCSGSDGFVLESWVGNEQTIDFATKNDIIYSLGPVNSFVTVYQHYDNGPLYRVTVGGASLSTPPNSLIARKMDGAKELQPQKVIVSVSNSGEADVYITIKEDGKDRLIPQGTIKFDMNSLNNANLNLAIGNNFDPDFSIADNKEESNSWRGGLYNLSLNCGYRDLKAITGMDEYRRVKESVAVSISGSDNPDLRKAAFLYGRIVGVKAPLDHPVVKQMAAKISEGRDGLLEAANIATQQADFLNITVRDFAAEMSNREETINVPLNDFIATVVGIVKDDRNAQLFLTSDEIYMGDVNKVPVRADMLGDLLMSNKHYEELEKVNADLSKVLVPVKQKISNGRGGVVNHPDPAGLLTSRAFMSSHHIAGTGRRPVEFSFREFLCLPIDQIADTGTGDANVMDNRIGRDIDRSPGGEPSKFEKNCKSCHVPMDGFRGAFAHFSWKDNFVNYGPIVGDNEEFDARSIAGKFNQNTDVYPKGYVTVDDSFTNYAVGKKNMAQIGWEDPASGNGVGEFARQLSRTEAFPRCMAKRVYKSVCKREPVEYEDGFIEAKAKEFASNGYNMRKLFASIAVARECIGD